MLRAKIQMKLAVLRNTGEEIHQLLAHHPSVEVARFLSVQLNYLELNLLS